MNIKELIHPEDAKALKALKSIPALPKIMEKIFEYGYDELSWSENVTTNLRLSETQMPEVYNRLPPICERLGIPVPELYLQMSPFANSWTSGHKKVYIVVTLGLIRRLKGEELDAVLLAGVLRHQLGRQILHALYPLALVQWQQGVEQAHHQVGVLAENLLEGQVSLRVQVFSFHLDSLFNVAEAQAYLPICTCKGNTLF